MTDKRSEGPGELRMMGVLCTICAAIIVWTLARYWSWTNIVMLAAN